jgi:ribosome-associated translation inhibitor RaiA
MEFEIRGRGFYMTETLREHIERSFCFALDRFARQILRVRVCVGDLNGPRGGIDKRCRIAIVLMSSKTVVMEDRDSNICVAIDRVADKAGRCIGRRLKRSKRAGPYVRISELLG